MILLDVLMPGMDGFETAALIRQREQSEMTPIIFITALRQRGDRRGDRYAEGAVDFIFSPVPPTSCEPRSVFANLFLQAEALAARAREVRRSADGCGCSPTPRRSGSSRPTQNRYVYTNPRWSEITGIPAGRPPAGAGTSIVGAEPRRL